MSATFSKTMRSLASDGPRRGTAGLVAAALGLAAWGAWFVLGRVAVHETSDGARIEEVRAAHPVAVEIAGRVVETSLAIGREVEAGDVLVRLDARAATRALDEARARLQDQEGRLRAVKAEVAAAGSALAARGEAFAVAVLEARAQAAEAEARARLAEAEVERNRKIPGLVSEEQRAKVVAEAEAARARAQAQGLAASRLEREREAEESDRRSRLAELERDAAELRGEAAVAAAAIRRLEGEVERHDVRAPVAGRVGEVAAELRTGSVVAAGDRLGSIVPEGTLRAVAHFPVAALGRVRRGQPARLRLDGYPWTRYGTIPAKVADVASEPRDGRIRVELDLEPDPRSTIPLEHGLPGTAEVEVERASPAALVLRAAGVWLRPGRGP